MTDAAERVLREHSLGAPMHYRRITELAIEHQLVVPGGLTPEASLNAAITTEIKRRSAIDREQRFAAYGRASTVSHRRPILWAEQSIRRTPKLGRGFAGCWPNSTLDCSRD